MTTCKACCVQTVARESELQGNEALKVRRKQWKRLVWGVKPPSLRLSYTLQRRKKRSSTAKQNSCSALVGRELCGAHDALPVRGVG